MGRCISYHCRYSSDRARRYRRRCKEHSTYSIGRYDWIRSCLFRCIWFSVLGTTCWTDWTDWSYRGNRIYGTYRGSWTDWTDWTTRSYRCNWITRTSRHKRNERSCWSDWTNWTSRNYWITRSSRTNRTNWTTGW